MGGVTGRGQPGKRRWALVNWLSFLAAVGLESCRVTFSTPLFFVLRSPQVLKYELSSLKLGENWQAIFVNNPCYHFMVVRPGVRVLCGFLVRPSCALSRSPPLLLASHAEQPASTQTSEKPLYNDEI